MKLNIADFHIEYVRDDSLLNRRLRNYIFDFEKYDIKISVTDGEIENNLIVEDQVVTEKIAEFNVLHQKIAEKLPENNSVVFHSVAFQVDGVGIAFTAHSGTGKTTHMRLWQDYLADKMVIVNGDKPIIRFFDDEPETPYAYGTPWNGKERYGCNMRTPLKHICFIERSETNSVEAVNKNDVIDRIMNQVYMPTDPAAMMKTMELIDRLLSSCKLWIIHCNMEQSAAEIAYKTIFNIKGE